MQAKSSPKAKSTKRKASPASVSSGNKQFNGGMQLSKLKNYLTKKWARNDKKRFHSPPNVSKPDFLSPRSPSHVGNMTTLPAHFADGHAMTSRSGTYESGVKLPKISITDPEDKSYQTEVKGVKPLEVFEPTEDISGSMFSPI